MYQGLGQMLTKCLQHHQGYPETPKSAYVIYGQPLIVNAPKQPITSAFLQNISETCQAYMEPILGVFWMF